jgi:hypothetical protein
MMVVVVYYLFVRSIGGEIQNSAVIAEIGSIWLIIMSIIL